MCKVETSYRGLMTNRHFISLVYWSIRTLSTNLLLHYFFAIDDINTL